MSEYVQRDPSPISLIASTTSFFNSLTFGERMVKDLKLGLMNGRPLTHKQIAATLRISERTSQRYLSNIMRKLENLTDASGV